MSRESLAILLIAISSLIGVLGQFLFKRSVLEGGGFSILGIDLVWFIAGGAVYLISLVIYVWALRWVPVHLAYPTLAIGYVVLFIGSVFNGVEVHWPQVAGVFFIVSGVFFLWA